MQRVPVSSSNLRAVGYENHVLEVEFRNGRVYQYSGIPAELHGQLMRAASKGRFLHLSVIDRYPTRRIR
ncbi:KTSC domain-containing protein [Streptomyces sp. SID14515]|uniref:KTSC domain-containing protein n=1 Tax=Streptomyces sp. SID14515 TaxID=2706074 RepID=UPI0013CB5696|nr:KTSC domain-containing protein [Streptomyces sp. SID14515]